MKVFPQKCSGLTALKTIIGMRGSAFARLVGIPPDTLKSIESGRRPLSPENAAKIHHATGVVAKSLYDSVPLRDYADDNTPVLYAADHYPRWREEVRQLGSRQEEAQKQAQALGESIGNWTKVLLRASVAKGKTTTFPILHKDLAKLLDSFATRYKLRPAINKILEEYPFEGVRKHTGAEWRAKWKKSNYSRKICEEYGVTATKLRKMKDYEQYEFQFWKPRSFKPHVEFLTNLRKV